MSVIIFNVFLNLFCFTISLNAEPKPADHKAQHEKEFTLTDEATRNFGIKFVKVSTVNGKTEVPLSAMVTSKDKKQIFLKHSGKFEVKDIHVVRRTDKLFITDDPIPEGAEVVVSGVNFLKVVEMSKDEDSSENHSH